MEINKLVEEILLYTKTNFNLLSYEDELFYRNFILGELDVEGYKEVKLTKKDEDRVIEMSNPDILVEGLTQYLKENSELSDNQIERKITKIMGFLTPSPSVVIKNFNNIYEEKGNERALKYLYYLSIKNDYVKKSKIDKNLVWSTNFKDKNLEISINLSKPEKSNKDIAKLLVKKDPSMEKYPKCLLCKENLGYYGRDDHPSRENIRLIPLSLDKERWYLQYSPYGYFNMHCIVLKDSHSNMVINRSTFRKLTEFVDQFPYFFIGSNADLPIVGGSILNHEHYQGGEHILPIMHSSIRKEFDCFAPNSEVKLYELDWYNSTILLVSKKREELVDVATKILDAWINYDDIENNILSHTENTRHNTITPCVRKVNDDYYLYLILRNNRCDEANPDGIFHAHKEYHHIKHEGIGIIEAMGLFILPARLLRQSNQIEEVIKDKLTHEKIVARYPDLDGNFLTMIDELSKNYNEKTISNDIREYINKVCQGILINTAVFKSDEKGEAGFERFINSIIF